jgi:predicted ATP-binding protein involved in virulence
MQLQHLYIENFRGFEERGFSFSPEFNLIIGNNGLGKTSVLEALAIAVGSWFLGIRGYDGRNILDRDIRRETVFLDKKFHFNTRLPVVVEATGTVAGKTITWKRELKSDVKRAKTLYKDATQLKNVAENAYELAKEGKLRLPLIAYYGAGRLWQVPRDTDKASSSHRNLKQPQDFDDIENSYESDANYFRDRFAGYKYSVDNRINPRFLMRWMAYERRVEIDEEQSSPAFRAVISAIQRALPEVRLVRFSIRHETLMLDFEDGRIVPFSDLSDGYKNVITIVGDIAAKAGLLNGHLGKHILDETDGIVLIDELDLHLHPKWQRRIIEDLRRTFPRIQFICTTHSPFLIQSLRSGEELIMLDGQPTAQLANMSVEEIAQGVMGIPNPQVSLRYEEMKGAAKHYLELLEEADKAPEEKLAEFKEQLADTVAPFADNPAFQAFLEMKRAVKLGE